MLLDLTQEERFLPLFCLQIERHSFIPFLESLRSNFWDRRLSPLKTNWIIPEKGTRLIFCSFFSIVMFKSILPFLKLKLKTDHQFWTNPDYAFNYLVTSWPVSVMELTELKEGDDVGVKSICISTAFRYPRLSPGQVADLLLPVKENVFTPPVWTVSSAEGHLPSAGGFSVEWLEPLITVQTWLVKLKSHLPQWAVASMDAGQTALHSAGPWVRRDGRGEKEKRAFQFHLGVCGAGFYNAQVTFTSTKFMHEYLKIRKKKWRQFNSSKSTYFEMIQIWIQNPVLRVPSSVTLSKSLILPKPQLLRQENGNSAHRRVVWTKWD